MTPVAGGALQPHDPPINATEGMGFSGLVATFGDDDGNTDPSKYSVAINWDDGSASSNGTVSYNSSTKQFQ